MNHNVEIDWKAFEFIFSGKAQSSFEQLAYILFCYEFNQTIGIFRYFNQTGIETEPIHVNDETIGFQAKYYDAATKISDKVPELCEMVDKSKSKNNKLSKILLYVNKELSESSAKGVKKPGYQEKIESYAKTKEIEIEWRVPSHIERMLLSETLPSFVKDFFFNPDKGIRNFIKQNELHSRTIIDTIENSIQCPSQEIILDRHDGNLLDFLNSQKTHMIIHGDAGTGKSGLIKKIYVENNGVYPIFVYKATDFGFNSLSEFSRQFGDSSVDDFLGSFSDSKSKIIMIDSSEKVFSMQERLLESFIVLALKHGWKIIHTIRTPYKENYINYVLKVNDYYEWQLNELKIEDLDHLIPQFSIPFPEDKNMRELLCNLFYLNLYVRSFREGYDSFKTRKSFLEHVWRTKVKGVDHELEVFSIDRELMIFKMTKSIFKSNAYYYNCDDEKNSSVLMKIKDDGIIDYDDVYKGYYFVHDIYEELAAQYLITHSYNTNQNEIAFFESLDINMPTRKHFRLWLRNSIKEFGTEKFKFFIMKSITNRNVDKIWVDEILISLIDAEVEDASLKVLEELFLEDDQLLLQTLFLLNTAGKMLDFDSASTYLSKEEIDSNISALYRYTKPSGFGWTFLIKYICEHLSELNWNISLIKQTYEMISSWTYKNKKGETTKYAGKIALYLYDLLESDKFKYKLDRDLKKEVSKVILDSSFEIENCLTEIYVSILKENELSHMHKYHCLVETLLENFMNSMIPCQVMPDLVIKLCNLVWKRKSIITEKNEDFYFYDSGRESVEKDFGLKSETHFDYHPTSAIQTPVLALLSYSFKEGINFVLDFMNECSEKYGKSKMKQDYRETFTSKITFLDGVEIEQIGSSRLWMMHRGASGGPYLLDCILMALEQSLLNNIPAMNKETANILCQYLLKSSKSIAITSVVCSLVQAFPDKLFDTACCLISMGADIFSLDIERLSHEDMSNSFRGILAKGYQYDRERIQSNKLEFRKNSFEKVIIDYQLQKNDYHLEKLYERIDSLDDNVMPENTALRYALNRIDLRLFKLKEDSETIIDGKRYLIAEVEEEEDLKLLREEREKEANKRYRFLDVSLWSKAKYEGNKEDSIKYPNFENQPIDAFEELKLLIENRKMGELAYLTMDAPYYIAAVLLKFYDSQVTQEQKEYCISFLLSELDLLTVPNQINNISHASIILVDSLPYLIKNCKNA